MADALTPGPHEAPELHDAIALGPYAWPPDAAYGAVKVKVKTGAKIEQQKANGKSRARTEVKGKKTPKVTLEFRYTRHI